MKKRIIILLMLMAEIAISETDIKYEPYTMKTKTPYNCVKNSTGYMMKCRILSQIDDRSMMGSLSTYKIYEYGRFLSLSVFTKYRRCSNVIVGNNGSLICTDEDFNYKEHIKEVSYYCYGDKIIKEKYDEIGLLAKTTEYEVRHGNYCYERYQQLFLEGDE